MNGWEIPLFLPVEQFTIFHGNFPLLSLPLFRFLKSSFSLWAVCIEGGHGRKDDDVMENHGKFSLLPLPALSCVHASLPSTTVYVVGFEASKWNEMNFIEFDVSDDQQKKKDYLWKSEKIAGMFLRNRTKWDEERNSIWIGRRIRFHLVVLRGRERCQLSSVKCDAIFLDRIDF